MTKTSPQRKKRSPNGMTKRPLVIRLSALERARVQALADRDCRSLSAVVRLATLRGLDLLEAQ